jgi:serine/threonine protein kinase
MTMSRANPNALPGGSTIDRYTVHNILGQGGFGITYLAHDKDRRQLVAIKEYLPTDLAVRNADGKVVPLTDDHREDFVWGLTRFIAEARILSKFEHPNVVSVLGVYETNGTAYMTMRYEEGASLAKILERGATLDENWLKKMVLPIIDGLSDVHGAGFIHRDIKPGNIYVREDQSPVLLDFGSARRTDGVATRTLTTLVSPGYAPFEQYYARSDKQGPWTDIYALGATLYRATVGSVPCDAIARSNALLSRDDDPYKRATDEAAERYGVEFLAAIDHALSFHEEERPQDLATWARELKGELFVIGSTMVPQTSGRNTVTGTVADIQPPEPSRNDRHGTRIRKAAIPIAVAAILTVWFTAYLLPVWNVNEMRSPIPGEAKTITTAPSLDRADVEVDRLMREAWRDFGEARFVGPGKDNAAARLRRVLEIDPENEKARNGLGLLHAYFLSRARRAADEGELRRAAAHASRAEATSTTAEERAAARQLIVGLRNLAGR